MEKSNCYLLKAISKLRNCLHLFTKLLLVDVGNNLIRKLIDMDEWGDRKAEDNHFHCLAIDDTHLDNDDTNLA